MTYLYSLLGILIVFLPVLFAFLYAGKRGVSIRTTAPFILPYTALIVLLFLGLLGLRGSSLFVGTLLAVGWGALILYVYSRIADIGLGQHKK